MQCVVEGGKTKENRESETNLDVATDNGIGSERSWEGGKFPLDQKETKTDCFTSSRSQTKQKSKKKAPEQDDALSR